MMRLSGWAYVFFNEFVTMLLGLVVVVIVFTRLSACSLRPNAFEISLSFMT